jgi:hypothetical protein
MAGDKRQIQLTVSNQGQGMLQGALKVTEGGQWLRIAGGSNNGELALKTPRDQLVNLQIDTRGLPAAQTYAAKLTVITNGGVVEVPVRMDLIAHPFSRQPFAGARTPREMAERMRAHPKAAVPLLENGEIGRWFAANSWNYPVRGKPARGVAGVQQFFEAMGLSKPPVVQVSQSEVRFTGAAATQRFQLAVQTTARKWVYANVESDSPWLKVLTPHVAGPQQAAITFEVNARSLPVYGQVEGRLTIAANAAQVLTVRVLGAGRRASGSHSRVLRPALTMALAFLVLRILLIPVADFVGRAGASRAAAARVEQVPAKASPLNHVGGWLHLPWPRILLGSEPSLPAELFNPGSTGAVSTLEFQHYFLTYLVRTFILWLWWLGAVLGVILMWRRGEGWRDLLWGLIAGVALGVAGAATLACLLLVVELRIHSLARGCSRLLDAPRSCFWHLDGADRCHAQRVGRSGAALASRNIPNMRTGRAGKVLVPVLKK